MRTTTCLFFLITCFTTLKAQKEELINKGLKYYQEYINHYGIYQINFDGISSSEFSSKNCLSSSELDTLKSYLKTLSFRPEIVHEEYCSLIIPKKEFESCVQVTIQIDSVIDLNNNLISFPYTYLKLLGFHSNFNISTIDTRVGNFNIKGQYKKNIKRIKGETIITIDGNYERKIVDVNKTKEFSFNGVDYLVVHQNDESISFLMSDDSKANIFSFLKNDSTVLGLARSLSATNFCRLTYEDFFNLGFDKSEEEIKLFLDRYSEEELEEKVMPSNKYLFIKIVYVKGYTNLIELKKLLPKRIIRTPFVLEKE